jgi:hypothetical protein
VCPKLSLSYLQSTLVLANLEELSDPLLIRRKASNFPDQTPDEENSFARFLHSTHAWGRDHITISALYYTKK